MAKRKNAEAAKAAKQKKMLIGLGVLLAVVGAIQVPKLMGGKGSTPAAAADSSGDPAAGSEAASTAAAPVSVPVAKPVQLLPGEEGKKPASTTLVGVSIRGGTPVRAAQGQLASFSLFEPKDPFAPQVEEKPAGADPAKETPASPEEPATVPEAPAGAPGDPVGGGITSPTAPGETTPTTPAAPVEPPRYATVSVNGVAESVELGAAFPRDAPMFVLAKVKAELVRIGIAGGKLESGTTAPVAVGDTITLVDSATGVRYVLKVISVGATPDITFTLPATTADPNAPVTAGTPPPSTATPPTSETTPAP